MTGQHVTAEEPHVQPGLKGKRILIVEDNIIIATDLAFQVGASGAKVVGTVGTVDAALEIIATADLDGAILDICLRGQMAFVVADALAARRIPFVFETGYLRRGEVPACYANVPCVEKPFLPSVVCYVLEGVMR
jgi:CheY-like chemotaxis protein